MSDQECPKCPPEGLPAWLATFADLMSLLMCFFVLLLSFSEMDVLKFKQIAGSMKFAFGVQNKIEVKDIPKGTSVIAMEFRPGRPEPTPIDTIQQQTIEVTQQMLEFQAGNEDSAGGRQKQRGEQRGGATQQSPSSWKKKLSMVPLRWNLWVSKLSFAFAKMVRFPPVRHFCSHSSNPLSAKSV
jgi:chemotaxis protein MotB